jgi:hypothetical protein
MRRAPLVVLAAVMTVIGCGIDVVGVDPSRSGAAGGAADASAATDGDLVTCSSCPAPAGWARVAYGDRTANCPGGLEALDLVTEPDGTTACTCACTTTPPACTSTTWGSKVDNSSTPRCDITSSVTHPVATGCVTISGNLGEHSQVIGPTATGGACAATAQKNAAAVKSRAVRMCRQKGATCPCDASAGLAACVATKGDKECPAGFPTKHLVGASADVTCGACACDVAQSCKASVTWFSDTGCATAIATIDSESCKAQGGGSYDSLEYKVEPIATCTTGAPPSGVAALVDPSTVCCPR